MTPAPRPAPRAADPRASRQFLLLAHLYAKTDARSLEFLRAKLLPARYSALQLGVAAGVATALSGGALPPPPPHPLGLGHTLCYCAHCTPCVPYRSLPPVADPGCSAPVRAGAVRRRPLRVE